MVQQQQQQQQQEQHRYQQQRHQQQQQQQQQQHEDSNSRNDELYFDALHSAALSFEDPLVALVLLQKLGPSLRDLDLDSATVIISHTAKNAQFLRDWGRGGDSSNYVGDDAGNVIQSPSEFVPENDRPHSRRGKRVHSSASAAKQQPSPGGSGSGGSAMTTASPGVNYFVRGLEESLGSPNAPPQCSDENDEEYLQADISPPSLRSPTVRPSTSRGLSSRDGSDVSAKAAAQTANHDQVRQSLHAQSETGAYDYAEVVKSSSVSVSSSAADDGDSTTAESTQYHDDAQLGELLCDTVLQAAQAVLNRLGKETLLSSGALSSSILSVHHVTQMQLF
jgi:hypothetical protein